MKIRKAIIIFICACLLHIAGQAQINLVHNASMEQHTICPSTFDQISLAKYWNSLDTIYQSDSVASYGLCAPDYCNTCATWYGVTVPAAQYYYQYPRTGNAMVQVQIFFDENYSYLTIRDYLQGELYTPLTAGQSYCVTYYVNLENGSGYATNNIDAYLDDGTIDTFGYYCGMPHTEIIPQITDTAVIYDTLNWIKIQGSFVANGTERFITIGNFHDKAHTNYVAVTYPSGIHDHFGFYLIDDVSVIASNATAYAGPDVSIAPGDTAWIGVDTAYGGTSSGDGMPCYWYRLGSSTAIDSGGRIGVHPTDSATYVVSMDLCGNVTYDTVRVNVNTLGIAPPGPAITGMTVYPNPVDRELTIEHAKNASLVISDVMGSIVYKTIISSEKETINTGSLPDGVYTAQFTNTISGERVTRKVVKKGQ